MTQDGSVTSGSTHELPTGSIDRFFSHGWHSWCRTSWIDPAVPPRPIGDEGTRLGHADPVHAFDTRHGGSGVGAVDHGDGSVTLLGALDPGAWVTLADRSIGGAYEAGSGDWVSTTGAEDDVFRAYAETLVAHLGRRGGDRVRLWSSWYSYYENVTETLMQRVLDGLDGLPFDVVQVDDGWQRAIGDWVANDDFPSGMADMALRISDTGRQPGLWLSPFIVAPHSETAQQRPELLLRDRAGDPVVAGVNWGGPCFALDVTHPGTEALLDELIGRVRGWGYEFLKLDFVYAAAFPGRHHRPMGRDQAYRAASARIRAAAGSECYLLACGAPIVASIGVYDGIRIGRDVSGNWVDAGPAGDEPPGTRSAVAGCVHRLWLKDAIDVDPDVVYFRSREATLDDSTKRHMRVLAQAAGFLGTSDPPDWLTGPERDALAEFLTEPATPRKTGRYVWELEGREYDFGPAVAAGVPS